MKKITKVLLIISIVALVLSIICGIGISTELLGKLTQLEFNDEYSKAFAVFVVPLGLFGSIGMLFVPVFFVCFWIAVIWITYGVILLGIKLCKKVKNKKLLLLIPLVLIISIGSVITINNVNQKKYAQSGTIGELAYSYSKAENEIYILENGVYVPYLILENNYENSGATLLLRKYLLDDLISYTNGGESSRYYAKSYIDKYLNTIFINTIDTIIREKINLSNIEITKEEVIESGEKDTEYIQRKIFLLSSSEVIDYNFSSNAVEGNFLEYFENSENKIATIKEGNANTWWFRTPNIYDRMSINVMSFKGVFGSAPFQDIQGTVYLGVRPAFTINSDIKVKEIFDEAMNKNIYVLDI